MTAQIEGRGQQMVQHTWIIHGTWSAPVRGKICWFQLDPNNDKNFCNKLSAALADGPLAGSLWRDIAADDVFSWAATNLHEDRLRAGEDLGARIIALRRADSRNRINLIAHSHGGNVILQACQVYRQFLVVQAGEVYDRAEALLADTYKGSDSGNADWHRAALEPEFKTCDAETLSVYGEIMDAILIRQDHVPAYTDWENHDRYNQPRRAFINRWLEAETSHIIGNLVFLGTPFLHKEWELPRASLLGAAKTASALVWHVLRAGLLAYVALLCLWGLSFLITLGLLIPAPSLNPFNWAGLSWLFFACFASYPLLLFRVSSKVTYTSDLYFDPSLFMGTRFRDREAPHEVVPRFNALVVTATHLDEAFLGLASEPLVLAKLTPWLRREEWSWRTAKAYIRAPLPQARIGVGQKMNAFRTMVGTRYYSNAPVEGPQKGLRRLATMALRTLSVAKDMLWLPVRKMVLEPYAQRIILNAVSGLAFGVTPEELKSARIRVRHWIGMPDYFDEDHWDITGDIVHGRMAMDKATVDRAAARQNYSYLVDEDALAEKIAQGDEAKNSFWTAIKDEEEALRAREAAFGYDVSAQAPFEHALARIAFSVEERAKELAGAVELNHSLYYNNATVIAGIAAFLESGTRGPGEAGDQS